MAGPFREVDFEHFVHAEATYNLDPTVVAGDAFRCRTRFPFKRVLNRLDRDQDSDNTGSVHTTQIGRESSTWEFAGGLTPSNVTGTPTPPDMGEFFRAHFGAQDIGVAHTTTTAGSTNTVVQLTAGGVAAAGFAVGDWCVVNDATNGLEARQIIAIATDAITMDKALTGIPGSGRPVYSTVTYRLSFSTILSLMSYSYLSGDNFREKVGGMATSDMEISLELGDANEAMVKFSGPGAAIQTLATSKPTPTLAGQPIVPLKSYAWFGTTKNCLTGLTLKSNNGMELRNNESCGNTPTGIKRTGNGGKYKIEMDIEMLLTTGTIDGYFDNADLLTAYDVTVQINDVLGAGFAFRLPKYVPDTEVGSLDGEVSLKLSGRAYGNGVADSELSVCFF